MNMKNIVLIILIGGFQNIHSAFLDDNPSSRSQALAGCGAALALGAENVWSNPALLAAGPRWEAGFDHRTYFGLAQIGRDQAALSACRRWGGAALGFSQFSALEIYREQSWDAAVGFSLRRTFLAGAGVRVLRLTLPEPYPGSWGVSSSAGAAGLFRQVRVAAQVRNLPFLRRVPEAWGLETAAVLGASARFLPRHLFSLELESREWRPPFLRLAQEITLQEHLLLRLGFISRETRLCAGFELRLQRLRFAYALQTHPTLGLCHTLGMRLAADNIR